MCIISNFYHNNIINKWGELYYCTKPIQSLSLPSELPAPCVAQLIFFNCRISANSGSPDDLHGQCDPLADVEARPRSRKEAASLCSAAHCWWEVRCPRDKTDSHLSGTTAARWWHASCRRLSETNRPTVTPASHNDWHSVYERKIWPSRRDKFCPPRSSNRRCQCSGPRRRFCVGSCGVAEHPNCSLTRQLAPRHVFVTRWDSLCTIPAGWTERFVIYM